MDTSDPRATKSGKWFFQTYEKNFVSKVVPCFPKSIETYHLTLFTLFWSALAITGGHLAKNNLNYLWLMSVAMAGQYFTDLFDGAVGRFRNTGLVKWGFYMDHLLDFCFLCSILIGYWFITPYEYKYILFAVFSLSAAYFVHMILNFGATNQFEISTMGIGPTEIRLIFVVVNTTLALFDKILFTKILILYFLINLVFLIYSIYKTQRKIWDIDMEAKRLAKKK